VDAFRRVRGEMPDAKLVIVGCTPEVSEPGVEIVGRISKDVPGGLERLLRLYSEASLLCIMSSFEAFGIVAVEAQNSFVPPLVPARFAFTETVVDGVTGRHVAEYDSGLLAKTMLEMLGDPTRLEAMGRAGHEHVRANYTWDVAARRIVDCIESDLAGVAHVR
jgi:glycosyltransferase involved in cell wall biosynthesis